MFGRLRPLNPLLLFGCTVVAAAAVVGTVVAVSTAPARFYVAHLSPDAPAVDVYVGGTLADSNLTYGQAGPLRSNGRYGEMLVEVRLAGTAPASAPVLSGYVNLHPGTTYVVAVANQLARLQIGAYAVPTDGVPAGMTRVQVLHAFAGAPRISARAGADVVVKGLGYLEEPPCLDVAAGEYRMLAFTDLTPTTLLLDQTRTLNAGTVETVILTGTPVQALFLTTQP